MYVAVKGGEKAIANAHRLLAEARRGDPLVPELTVAQIEQQMGRAVDRVMNEGALYDPRLAAIAIKQAQGDLCEAIFLLRAYRTTLPRLGFSSPLETESMALDRRISAVFKDLPGGQSLGATCDYTHRLLDFSLAGPAQDVAGVAVDPPVVDQGDDAGVPRVADILRMEGLMAHDPQPEGDAVPGDLTREPLSFPADRPVRLQNLSRGDEGFLLSLAYSAQRGFGSSDHPFVGEIRVGSVAVFFEPGELGFPVVVGELTLTECMMITPCVASPKGTLPQLTAGYGLTFGYCERKAMAMAVVDRTLCSREYGEKVVYPAQDEAFVLSHSDNLESSGFVQHLKLPHYVDFQSELVILRTLQAEYLQEREHDDALPN